MSHSIQLNSPHLGHCLLGEAASCLETAREGSGTVPLGPGPSEPSYQLLVPLASPTEARGQKSLASSLGDSCSWRGPGISVTTPQRGDGPQQLLLPEETPGPSAIHVSRILCTLACQPDEKLPQIPQQLSLAFHLLVSCGQHKPKLRRPIDCVSKFTLDSLASPQVSKVSSVPPRTQRASSSEDSPTQWAAGPSPCTHAHTHAYTHTHVDGEQ